MRRSLMMLFTLAPLAGCAIDGDTPAPIRPGLEPLANRPPPSAPVEAPAIAAPRPLASAELPFPPASVTDAEAEVLLAGDPMALRFLGLRQLTAAGLVPADDSRDRADANMGVLLPLTTVKAPAAGLDLPAPPPSALLALFHRLAGRPPAQTEPERLFILDNLLPIHPTTFQSLVIPDLAGARAALSRLPRLEQVGLIDADQRAAEEKAVQALIDGGTLPEKLVPPAPPPPPPAPKPAKKPGGGSGARMPGGVSGQLKIIPSPAGVEPPPLAKGFSGQAGLHLLSMGAANQGDKAWAALTKEHADLASLGFKVVRADLGDLGVTYRLIAGPVPPADAEKICAALKPRGQSCQPTPFP